MTALNPIPLGSSIRKLDDGRTPWFRFYRQKDFRKFDVFVHVGKSDEIHLGAIFTRGMFCRGVDPGNWFVLGGDGRAFDSMNEAAQELLKGERVQ